MKVWKIVDKNQIQRAEVAPPCGEDLIKVRVARAMLTHADFDNYLGKCADFKPVVPSKGAIGLISDANNPLGLSVGEKVLLTSYTPPCGEVIDEVRPYSENLQIRGLDCDGYLSDFAYANRHAVYSIPDNVSDLECLYYDYIAVSLSCMQRMKIEKGEYVAILGGDVQSIIFAEVVSYYQAIPILISSNQNALKLASSHGIDYVINSSKEDAVAKVFEITGGKLAEHACFSVYSELNFTDIFSLVTKLGKIGIIGYDKQSIEANIDLNTILDSQFEIYAIKEGMKEIMSTLNLLAMKVINLSDFDTMTINFSEVGNTFSSFKPQKTPNMVVVDCNDA